MTRYASNLLTTPAFHDHAPRYTASGMLVPPADARSRDVADQAARWLAFAAERSRMRPPTLVAKALQSVAFSVQHGAASLAVPSKLSGTRPHQRALWAMVSDRVPAWAELALEDAGAGLVVRYGGERIGELQTKHAGWVRPLVPFGLRIYLARVTGHDYEAYTLGVNVAIGHVGAALDRLLGALGSGDGAASAEPVVAEAPASSRPRLQLAARHGVAVRPEHDAVRPRADPDDVVLYRRLDGTACASVEHVARHSPTGIDWGRSGSGPADLARSVLLSLTDEATAERLYAAFADEVVARVRFCGGVLRAADVRDWVARQSI